MYSSSHPLSDNFLVSSLDPFQQVHIFLVLGTPELDAILQLKSQESGLEEDKSPPSTCWPHFFGCSPAYYWLQVHIASSHLMFHFHVLLHKATLNPFNTQPALTQVKAFSVTLLDFLRSSLWM